MTEQELSTLIKLRVAVYQCGRDVGFWPSLEANSAKEMMEYVFPKTGNIAYLHLMTETVKSKIKDMFTDDYYNLYKFPVQIEKDLLNYLKRHKEFDVASVGDAKAYIDSLATITCDESSEPIYIGRLQDSEPDSLLRVMAFHYKNAFKNKVKSFPYFN